MRHVEGPLHVANVQNPNVRVTRHVCWKVSDAPVECNESQSPEFMEAIWKR